MNQIQKVISHFHKDESGQDLLEYALVLAAVLAAVVTGSQTIAGVITNAMTHLDTVITGTVAKVS
jgi:Flp pilus assembly pilin Flp